MEIAENPRPSSLHVSRVSRIGEIVEDVEEFELDPVAVDELFANTEGRPADDDILNWLSEEPVDEDDPTYLKYDPRCGF